MGHATRTLKVVNLLLAPAVAGRKKKVDTAIEKLVDNAEKETGAKAGEHREYIEDCRFLLNCYADEPNASFLGWTAILGDVQRRITNRLRVAKAIAERPEIEAEPIEAPIVVTGLPRTATTLAHNLIAGTEQNRAPLFWELFSTIPGDADEAVRREAIESTQKWVVSMNKAVPVFPDIHPMAATLSYSVVPRTRRLSM